MGNVRSRDEWGFASHFKSGKLTKSDLVFQYETYFFRMLVKMFRWENLPEGWESEDIERKLLTGGFIVCRKVGESRFYGNEFTGCAIGGKLNWKFLPKTANISNPYMPEVQGTNLEIGKECVVIKSDSFYEGLSGLVHRYAVLLAECVLTMRIASVNARVPAVLSADSSNSAEGLKEVILKAEEGEEIGVVASGMVSKGIQSADYGRNSVSAIKDMIELMQYIKGSFFLEIGIDANYNMKRSYISDAETGKEDAVVLPFIDDMMQCRKDGAKQWNEYTGDNIKPVFDSAWKKLRDDLKQIDEIQQKMIDDAGKVADPQPAPEEKKEGDPDELEDRE